MKTTNHEKVYLDSWTIHKMMDRFVKGEIFKVTEPSLRNHEISTRN